MRRGAAPAAATGGKAAPAAAGGKGAPAAAPAKKDESKSSEAVVAAKAVELKGDKGADAVTGEAVAPLPEGREDVVANNRLRREIEGALAAFKLLSPERALPAWKARATLSSSQ